MKTGQKASPAYEQVNKLASALCKGEDGKSESKVGDMRETLGLLADAIHRDPAICTSLKQYGAERAAKNSAKKASSK